MGDKESQTSNAPIVAETENITTVDQSTDIQPNLDSQAQNPTGQPTEAIPAQASYQQAYNNHYGSFRPQPNSTMQMPPIVQPAPNIAGGVYPATTEKPKKPKNKLLIVGIIVCAIAIALLIAALIYVSNQPAATTTPTQTTPNVEAPASSEVEKAYQDAKIDPPNLSSYSYINEEGLSDPKISDIIIGEVAAGESNGKQTVTCNTNATATFENDSVRVVEPLNMRFTYGESDKKWTAGQIQTSNPAIEPIGPADIEAIQKDMPNLLKEYDADIASRFEGCEYAAAGDLTNTGGTLTFTLKKQVENGEPLQCDVNVDVEWKNNKGWDANISSISDPSGKVTYPSSNSSSSSSDNSNSGNSSNTASNTGANSGNAALLLVCNTGDLVEVPGITLFQNDQVLLKTDETIRVELDGQDYTVNYFQLTADSFRIVNGQHVAAIGEISATGTLPQAPLVLNLDSV